MDDSTELSINLEVSTEARSPLKALTNKEKNGAKRMSVERIYQRKSPLEHILLRPDTYIGSVEMETKQMWVFDEGVGMVLRDITYVPGIYKIFDEILVNAADNKQRDKNMNCIRIDIDSENNEISIYNNGKGIPVIEHKVEKMWVPTLIFGHLLTSSNYNDEEKKVVGGRNGYGAKLCNVFSTKFIVETSYKEHKKSFKQRWTNNMRNAGEPKITASSGDDYTKITFHPDLNKFKMNKLDKDIVALFSRRAYDVAGSSKGVKVFLNGKRLPVSGFKDYIDQFIKDKEDETGNPLRFAHEVVNDRWEIAVTVSDKGFQQNSFVNSIATTRGGKHVDYIADQIVGKMTDIIKKKNKAGVVVKPFQIRNHLWVFVNCLIENPTFDSQTKETMTLQSKSFGSKCAPTDKFFLGVNKIGVIEAIMTWVKFKAETELAKNCHAKKHAKLKGIPKLEDANDAGTKNSIDCTLILTEGDSAKSLVVAGLGVIGRDKYGVFPLRGKMLNVREASHKQILENAEINNLIKIMGLQYKKKYESQDDLKSLRYGKIMIMTDQDQDGSHIKGLLINFVHHNWPSLLKLNFLEEFITPIVKVTKGTQVKAFYSLPEFEEWKKGTTNWCSWKVKYYKGLGTSTSVEAKEYFSEIRRHRITFKYQGADDDHAVMLAFSKKMVEQRKDWLTSGMEERKRRREQGMSEMYLYEKETRSVSYKDFIDKELILFSNLDNERSIPSLMDGLKPGQRKVMFTCFKRNDKREVKVAQLAGSVGEHSAYHHGEASLMSTIINLAQDYVGSNNINLLQPRGQFGTRLQGGKDAASPRYIFTMLSPLARKIFPACDEPLLNSLFDDNQKIEPEYYAPILPMILVNGADGIGTGWSTKIPNYNPKDIVNNLRRMIHGDEILPMKPWFRGFLGTIVQIDSQRFVVNGEMSILDSKSIEITELPIRVWTQNYKESTLEVLLHGNGEKVASFISDYKEHHTDSTIRFVVQLPEANLEKALQSGIHKLFKLQTSLSTTSMVMFDHNGCIRRYETPDDIIKEFFPVRLNYYVKRKQYYEGMLSAEAKKLENQARFILEKNESKIKMENVKKVDFVQILIRRGYDSDPVKAWKIKNGISLKDETESNESEESDNENASEAETSSPAKKKEKKRESKHDYDYLFDMTMRSMLREKVEELLKKRDTKKEELEKLKKSTPEQLWEKDLNDFIEEYDKEMERQSAEVSKPAKTVSKGISKLSKNKQNKISLDSKPAANAQRIEPKIDPEFYRKAEKASTESGSKKGTKMQKKRNLRHDDNEIENEVKMLEENNSKSEDITKKLLAGKKLKQTTLSFKPLQKSSMENTVPTKTATKKANNTSAESDATVMDIESDSDEEFIPKELLPKSKKPKVVRKRTAVNKSDKQSKKPKDESSNDSSDHEPKKKKKIMIHSDSESSSVQEKPRENKKKRAEKSVFSDDSDEDILLNERIEARSQPNRARNAAKYVFSDDDTD